MTLKKKVQNKGSSRKTPRVLLAGAAGFIGSFLAESLVDAGCQVVGLDNLSTGSWQNLRALKGKAGFELIRCDLKEGIPKSVDKMAFTHVVSAVGVSPAVSAQEKKELDELLLSALATKNLLDLAVRKRAIFLLISSTQIYQGVAGSLSLEHYYDHSRAAAQLSFLEGRRFAEALTQEYSDLYDLDARLARAPTVYGPRMNLGTGELLARMVKLTLSQKDLVLEEDGSQEYPLVYVTDLVYGLIKLLLGQSKDLKKSIFTFVNPEKTSVLSVAYVLKEHYPPGKEPQVEFLPPESSFKFQRISPHLHSARAQKLLFWEPQVNLSQGIKLTLDYFRSKEKEGDQAVLKKEIQQTQERLKQPQIARTREKLLRKPTLLERVAPEKGWLALKKKQEQGRRPSLLRGVQARSRRPFWQGLPRPILLLAVVMAVLVVVLTPSAGTAAFSLWGVRQLEKKEFGPAQASFLRAQSLWGKNRWVLQNLGQKELFLAVDRGLTAAFFAGRTLQDLWPAATGLGGLAKQVVASSPALAGEGSDTNKGGLVPSQAQETLRASRAALQSAQKDGQLFSENFRLACREGEGSWFARLVLKCEKTLPAVRQLPQWLKVGQALLSPSNDLLGFAEAPQTTLVLLQNNNELRATGGFLGSYAAVDFTKGRVTRLKVDDIYNPDGILQQKITAPPVFAKYMGVKELGLRDANWWPDFPESAEKVATLYEFATGEKVAQVVGINLSVAQELLKVVGRVSVPSYQEEITADNLFERAEVHSEVGFKEGSTQKKDFLGELTNQIVKALLHSARLNHRKLAASLLAALAQKDILFYSRNPEVQGALVGSLVSGEVRGETSGDYLYLVDSNIAGNKANFWVKRSSAYSLDVDRNGYLTASLRVHWQHTGRSETWPSGAYKNFLRVYVPRGAKLIEEGGFADKVEVYEEFGKTVMAALVEVPINSEKQVTLKYQLPKRIGFQDSGKYSLLIQKQSGLGSEEFAFELHLPVFLQLKRGWLRWAQELTTDTQKEILVAPRR